MAKWPWQREEGVSREVARACRLERREQRPLLRQEELQCVVRVEDRVGVGDVGAAVRKGALVHGEVVGEARLCVLDRVEDRDDVEHAR